jgi:hypothetical protein
MPAFKRFQLAYRLGMFKSGRIAEAIIELDKTTDKDSQGSAVVA